MIWLIILKTVYFALPAYIANMAPVLVAKPKLFNWLNYPIDMGKTWGNKPILGKGKTWRGLIIGTLAAMAVAGLQSLLYHYESFRQISVINFNETSFILFGFLAGMGALLGDILKSFIKRRINISSGRPWPIADQLDFIFGFILATWWLVRPSWEIIAALVVLTIILHPLTNIIGYALKIKKVWW